MDRQPELDLAGKVVVITGVSRGMGREAALGFARRGAHLVLAARTVDRDEVLPGTLGDTLSQVEAMGAKAVAVPTDLAKREDLQRLVDTAVETFGGVDILVNNAAATTGASWTSKFLDLDFADWLHQFDVNLHAPFLLMQMVTPIMEQRGGGRIVNITAGSGEALRLPEEPRLPESMAGVNLVIPAYFASKRALDRLGSVIAPDLAKRNVFVITMHPGWVATENVASRLENMPAESLPDARPVPMAVPARMMVYFAACENPREYNGRVFWAEREMADMGIAVD